MPTRDVALFTTFPQLTGRLPWVRLGEWPTPTERLEALDAAVGGGPCHVKRDDLSAQVYGGNKVRTLEPLFGQARAVGARAIWATGAFGSNHALATVLHARAAGFEPGALLFPQPPLPCARENLEAILGARPALRALASWATLPFGMLVARRDASRYVMSPGGATPEGALGYVSAAFELVAQVRRGELPLPARVLVGLGSTCTMAGLVAGFAIAGVPTPEVWGVRVSPWPVTSRFRIVSLAARTLALLAALAGDARLAVPRRQLASRVRVIGDELGRGYGYATVAGRDAALRLADAGGPPLDLCYSAKVAAALFSRPAPGPVLFWSTKNSRPLPPRDADAIAAAPAAFRKWLARPAV